MWRDLMRRLGSGRSGRNIVPSRMQQDEVWGAVDRLPTPESDVLVRIEQTALEVYASHGLPTARGQYRRGPRARFWTFLGDDLTPEARWALMLDQPPERGWRYGSLADIGRTGVPDVRAASGLLMQCARLRTFLTKGLAGDRLQIVEDAVRLGAAWRELEASRVKTGSTRLRLMAPDETPPKALPIKRPGRKRPQARQ